MNKRKSCVMYLYQDSLARRMKELGVSRAELATMTGLSPCTILTACNGRPVSVRTIAKFLNTYKLIHLKKMTSGALTLYRR